MDCIEDKNILVNGCEMIDVDAVMHCWEVVPPQLPPITIDEWNRHFPENPIPVVKYKAILTLDDGSTVGIVDDGTGQLTLQETSAYSATCISVLIADFIEEIGAHAFDYFPILTSVKFEEFSKLKVMRHECFDHCWNLEYIELPNGLEVMENAAIGACPKLKKCVMPDTVVAVGREVFSDCHALEEFHISTGLTVLEYAFAYATNLSEVVIPSGITRIGAYSFNLCTSLKTITFKPSTPPRLLYAAFMHANLEVVYVPRESLDLYKATYLVWASIIQPIT